MKKILRWKGIILRRLLWFFYPIKTNKYNSGIIKLGLTQFSFIPNELLNAKSIIYSFGAGEDIHWEIELIRKYSCNVFLFDPTPRSLIHVNTLIDKTLNGVGFCSADLTDYNATPEIVSKLNFSQIALWKNNEIVKFFEPLNTKDVSHSITNLQETDKFINVQAKTIKTIMQELGHNYIDFLKLDIEGAEYDVLFNLKEELLTINSICLELHYSQNISEYKNVKRVYDCIKFLEGYGFRVIDRYGHKYFTLINVGKNQ